MYTDKGIFDKEICTNIQSTEICWNINDIELLEDTIDLFAKQMTEILKKGIRYDSFNQILKRFTDLENNPSESTSILYKYYFGPVFYNAIRKLQKRCEYERTSQELPLEPTFVNVIPDVRGVQHPQKPKNPYSSKNGTTICKRSKKYRFCYDETYIQNLLEIFSYLITTLQTFNDGIYDENQTEQIANRLEGIATINPDSPFITSMKNFLSFYSMNRTISCASRETDFKVNVPALPESQIRYEKEVSMNIQDIHDLEDLIHNVMEYYLSIYNTGCESVETRQLYDNLQMMASQNDILNRLYPVFIERSRDKICKKYRTKEVYCDFYILETDETGTICYDSFMIQSLFLFLNVLLQTYISPKILNQFQNLYKLYPQYFNAKYNPAFNQFKKIDFTTFPEKPSGFFSRFFRR